MKLSKAYLPKEHESDIYELWENTKAFQPHKSSPSYSIVMPPPNANANLHLGHVLTFALEDIAARYHRLKGESVMLLPGADHAGFETQSVYEKQLAKDGKSRLDFSREDLYQQIWDFVALNRGSFENQMRKIGVSCDWESYTFTLDNKIVARAYATFRKMWNEGLIYRGERLVNYCTFHDTAFADIEVVYSEEQGSLWHISYPLSDGSGEIIVATTRPETMLGDTAVAVNPNDERYKGFLGKTVKLPLTSREIPVIEDDYVDIKFGTGAVKITPAHDINDFEVGKRHDLPFKTVISHAGKLIDVPDKYEGLGIGEARQRIVNDLKGQGFLVKTETHLHNVGHCYKCNTIIQPLLREQWFVNMKPLAGQGIKALKDDKIKFYPTTKKTQLINYLEGLRDWNISRQIAWGIPIPAFQNIDEPDDWIYDERVKEEIIKIGDKTYRRDPDVFDTWFSSSSWPYATLDYPDDDKFKQFYPLSLMETGGEILYPWVSRMLLLGLYVTGEIPFEEVYIHGYVMAEDGSKMSKSVGNVVDPLPIIDEYGSDALRMGIIWGRAAAVNRGFDIRKVEEARNFCNKLWNVARYIDGVVDESHDTTNVVPTSAADDWILMKLGEVQKQNSRYLDNYRYSEAYDNIYHFIWDDLADWYVEASKANLNKNLLSYVLKKSLLLTHPFAPFVTESIWQALDWEPESILATMLIGDATTYDKSLAEDFSEIQSIVKEIRYIQKAMNLKQLSLHYTKDDTFVEANSALIKQLASLSGVSSTEKPSGHRLDLTSTSHNCWLDIDESSASGYVDELKAKKLGQASLIKQLEGRLSNDNYVNNAPTKVVDQTRLQLTEAQELLATIDTEINRFSS
jgi:valyl-tRNA synthetase